MKKILLAPALLAMSLVPQARADNFTFTFAGPGVSGTIAMSYGSATDATYPQALVVTGVSGTFSDSNNGLNLVNVPILSLVPISPATPETGNTLAPADFSRFGLISGLPPDSGGYVTYDNLFYPGGSPQTASSYPFAGGIFDIYGLMVNISGGDVVDIYSNGSFMGSPLDYGVAVATSSTALDYVGGGVQITQVTPEPSSYLLLGTGLLAMLFWMRRGARFTSLSR